MSTESTNEQALVANDRPATPLPKRQLFALLGGRFGEPTSFTVIFPFVYFIRDFQLSDDEEMIGYYAGFLTSCFAITQFISSLPWGNLSDRIGRRPVILAGQLGTMICSLLFGMSKSFTWALVTRSLSGLLNGNNAVSQSMLTEITDETNQARAFTLIPMIWGIGCIVGPTIGGFLSYPADKFPTLFGESAFMREYPFFLPCAVCALINACGFIITYTCLEETLGSNNATIVVSTEDTSSIDHTIDESTRLLNGHEQQVNYAATLDEQQDISIQNDVSHTRNDTTTTTMEQQMEYKASTFELASIPAECWTPILVGASLAFQAIVFEEVFPIWAAAPVEFNGLALTSDQIGSILSLAGIYMLDIQLFVYPKLDQYLGPHRLFGIGMLCYTPILLLFPWISQWTKIEDNHAEGASQLCIWLSLCLGLGWQIACNNICFIAYSLVLVETARQSGVIGRVNGIAVGMQSLTRAIGPAFGGIVWSWSLQRNLAYPFDYTLIWNIIGCSCFITALVIFRIKPKPSSTVGVVMA
ncbi:major facilitator superfamily domain-containing protein [Syncephalis plumigaleata]|nr:major facilitator superfamily domain-containing protein [Syncephalis plumigaleata]